MGSQCSGGGVCNTTAKMASNNTWENRIEFIVRYMYDIDGSGSLDINDFDCLAVKNTIMEGKGSWDEAKFQKNKNVMQGLWDEIALIADFDKNGEVDTEEFMKGVEGACKGKAYQQFPEAFKFFIESCFRTLDADGDGSIGLDEFRYDCVSRMAYASVQDLDDAYERLLNDEDKKLGGITLERYQELYAQFLGNPDENCTASYLFGPLPSL